MSDNINHPEHYQNIAGVEAIDILNDVVKDLPGTQAALLWNALKYQLRFQNKNGVEDLKKARNYLKYLIDNMESAQGTDNKTKAKVDKAIIIVTGTREEPYFEILYHLIGDPDDRIGFGSYCLTNVFNWREQHLEVVNKEDK
jgi:hypothetical protein